MDNFSATKWLLTYRKYEILHTIPEDFFRVTTLQLTEVFNGVLCALTAIFKPYVISAQIQILQTCMFLCNSKNFVPSGLKTHYNKLVSKKKKTSSPFEMLGKIPTTTVTSTNEMCR
jgi:GR25 family glycosyltransferase involved in LPS biosynthesis